MAKDNISQYPWLYQIKKGMDNTTGGPTGSEPRGLSINRTLSIRNVLKDLMEWDDWGDAAESNYMGDNRIPVDRSELADFQNGGFLLEDQGYTINGPAAKFSFKDNLSENEYEVVVQKKRGFNEKS